MPLAHEQHEPAFASPNVLFPCMPAGGRRTRSLCPARRLLPGTCAEGRGGGGDRVTVALATSASTMSASLAAGMRSRVTAAVAAGLLAFAPAIHIDRMRTAVHLQVGDAALAAKGGGDTFLSASGAVNKDGESLLRWSLPIANDTVRELQESLESAITNTRGLKWGKIDGDLRRAKAVVSNKAAALLKSVPEDRVDAANALVASISDAIPRLLDVAAEKKVEKLVDADKVVLRDVGKLEELMVTGFPYEVPPEFSNLPQLKGRATVEVVVRKADDEPFDIDGTIYKEGAMTLVIDGFSAPLSAGSFVDLVAKGFYDNRDIIRSDGFIIQTGKPDSGDGYTIQGGSAARTIPLEVFARGDKAPVYGMTLEDDGRGTAATVLPFSSFGTLAMAREEFEPNTASSQFFWFLFEPDLTPAGRNLMDGSWAVFGYTVNGEKFLKGLQRGDRLVSAKVVAGLENLVNAS
jgi:peptidylprolyl isomerase